MLAPIKCQLPVLSQAGVYFKDASLPASNKVIIAISTSVGADVTYVSQTVVP